MNQKVIYSTLLSPAKTQVEKGDREGWREVLHTLTPSLRGAFLKLRTRWGFQIGIRRKWTSAPWRVARYSDDTTHRSVTVNMDPCAWKRSSDAWTRKNSPPFSLRSIFPTFLSFRFSLHPFTSPSVPLQSLQSAVSYGIPLQPSDAALQRGESCMCMLLWEAVHVQHSVSERGFRYLQGISSWGTQQWCPQPIFILQCVQTVFLFFLNLERAVSNVGLAQKCDVLQGSLLAAAAAVGVHRISPTKSPFPTGMCESTRLTTDM